MASIVETKAVALRRGTHEENLAFTGVQGEAVVDLGIEDTDGNLGVDANTTLRIHNGITKGGIPLARADLLNVSTQMLAEERTLVNDKNLAYADLSNLQKVSSITTRDKIVSTLHEYGLAIESDIEDGLANKANKNMSNVNTSDLATSGHGHQGENLAYANTSNINTADLVNTNYHPTTDTRGNKPLAYADTTNINNASLVDIAIHPKTSNNGNKPLAYYDFSNSDITNLTLPEYNSNLQGTRPATMNGPVLARADLDNVESSTIIDKIGSDPTNPIDFSKFEKITRKDEEINETSITSGNYPATQAVVNYISQKLSNNADVYLLNVLDWENLYSTSKPDMFKINAQVSQSQTGFELGETYNTGIYLKDDPQDFLLVKILQVNGSGGITNISLVGDIGTIDLTSYNPFTITSGTNVIAKFNINSVSNGNNEYKYTIGSIVTNGSGFEVGKEYFVKSTVSDEYYKIIYKQLQIIPISLSDIQNSVGKIKKAMCVPEYAITQVSAQTATIRSLTNTTATLAITSSFYINSSGAGVAKTNLTNLGGMSATDQVVETNSNWRIRHDEPIPSTSQTTIPNEQDYTIATNGNVWRALKQIDISSMLGNIPSVTFKAKFIPNSSYTTDNSTLFDSSETNFIMDSYGHSTTDNYKKYLLLPNHEYNFVVYSNNSSDNYMFTTGNAGSTKTIEYSIASITFNTNVQTATLNLTRNDGKSSSKQISNGTVTICISNDTNWSISKEGYSSISGSLSVSNGNQTLSITLDEES